MRLQLRRRPSKALRAGLAMASSALLGSAAGADELPPVESEASVLYYSETDRVTAVEAHVQLGTEVAEDQKLTLSLVFDSLTGASPNGAVPSRNPQTFTTASGRGSYRIAAGDSPLDPQFTDSRVAVNLNYDRPLGRRSRWNVGTNVSSEHDYLSLALSTGVTRDFNQRNTTLSLGTSVAKDRWNPEGGVPIPFAAMAAEGSNQPRLGATDDKWVFDVVGGLTQVLDRRTVARVNYTLSRSSGYLTDPFKLVSVVDGAGDPLRVLYENRPDSRTRHSLYAQIKRHLGVAVADFSYRYHTDDWNLDSHTFDGRLRWKVGERNFVQPHARYYRQTAAHHYRRFLVDGQALPDFATADPRLAEFEASTLGVKLGRVLPDGNEASFTLEWYRQFGFRGPPDGFGALDALDLQPDLDAIMVRVGFGHDWAF